MPLILANSTAMAAATASGEYLDTMSWREAFPLAAASSGYVYTRRITCQHEWGAIDKESPLIDEADPLRTLLEVESEQASQEFAWRRNTPSAGAARPRLPIGLHETTTGCL